MEPTELRTKRLLLRPWRLSDVDDVFAYASDVHEPYLRRDAEEFVAHAVLASRDQEPILGMVFENRAVGGLSLDLDLKHRTAELGYWVGKHLWGRGLAPEAAKAVIDWGFQSFPIGKVFAGKDARNRQSVRVMEKLRDKISIAERYPRPASDDAMTSATGVPGLNLGVSFEQ